MPQNKKNVETQNFASLQTLQNGRDGACTVSTKPLSGYSALRTKRTARPELRGIDIDVSRNKQLEA